MDPSLCGMCRSISFDAMRSPHGFDHHPKASILRLAAERSDGCALCNIMWRALCENNRPPAPHISQPRKVPSLRDDDQVRLLFASVLDPTRDIEVERMDSFIVVCSTPENLNRVMERGRRMGNFEPAPVARIGLFVESGMFRTLTAVVTRWLLRPLIGF